MTATLTTFELPLRLDAHGTIRVGRSRVTLDTVIELYHHGTSPEVIAQQFPAVTLAEVYGTIAYYLQHQPELDTYLKAREEAAAPLVAELAARSNPPGTRERLRARLAAQLHGD
jgi:uncharacterized protein (DUF433 family)